VPTIPSQFVRKTEEAMQRCKHKKFGLGIVSEEFVSGSDQTRIVWSAPLLLKKLPTLCAEMVVSP